MQGIAVFRIKYLLYNSRIFLKYEIMSSISKESKDRITKELALAITPIFAAYLFITFYEAGFVSVYSIPYDLISINITDIVLTNRITLMVAVLAFLWIGLYYNILPSANSPVFKGMITFMVILGISLGFTFGKFDALRKTDYLVMNTEPEQVVLKIYRNKVISAAFDRKHKTVKKQFSFTRVGDNADRVYRLEKLGPLTPK